MPYDPSNRYQKRLARYVNNKVIFKTRSWEEYKDGYTDSRQDYLKLLSKREKDNSTRQMVL
jgi:hypothetical protein